MTTTPTASQPAARQPVYVYIAGRGHSGSTLLTLLLARHPRVAAVGELSLLPLQIARDGDGTRWVGQCGCGERPLDCPVWGSLLAEVGRDEGVDFARTPFRWRISDVGMEEEYRGRALPRAPLVLLRNRLCRLLRSVQYQWPRSLGPLLAWYRPQAAWAARRSRLAARLAAHYDVDAIVDASKDPLDMLDLCRHATRPVRIVFLTRDARGNVWSMLRRRVAHGLSRDDAVAPAAREWKKVNGRIWRLFRRVPADSRMHIRYEDLCRDPERTMARLFDFIGLGAADVISATGEAHAAAASTHTIGGNKIRFTGKPLEVREDVAWQSNLTRDELTVIDEVAGGLSRALGYERPAGG